MWMIVICTKINIKLCKNKQINFQFKCRTKRRLHLVGRALSYYCPQSNLPSSTYWHYHHASQETSLHSHAEVSPPRKDGGAGYKGKRGGKSIETGRAASEKVKLGGWSACRATADVEKVAERKSRSCEPGHSWNYQPGHISPPAIDLYSVFNPAQECNIAWTLKAESLSSTSKQFDKRCFSSQSTITILWKIHLFSGSSFFGLKMKLKIHTRVIFIWFCSTALFVKTNRIFSHVNFPTTPQITLWLNLIYILPSFLCMTINEFLFVEELWWRWKAIAY